MFLTVFDDKGVIWEYIFLTEDKGNFIPNVRYCETDPDPLLDDFNAGFEFLGDVETEYSIDFFDTDDAGDGTRIFVRNGEEITLLQYDPLDDGMPEFRASTEKIAYFKMNMEDLKKLDFSKVKFTIE